MLTQHTAIGKTFMGLVPSPQQAAAFLQQGVQTLLVHAWPAWLLVFLPQAIGQPLAMLGPALMAMIGPGPWVAVGYLVGYPILEWACDELFESSLDASVRISDFQSGVAVFY